MRYLLSLLMAAVCCGRCVLAETPATHDPAPLQALVKQLGSRDFDEREVAKLKLAAAGYAAREVLTKAREDADPEISASAVILLNKINRAVVAVRVVDSTEKPLAEFPVIFSLLIRTGDREYSSVLHKQTVMTDANGWACVGDLMPGRYILHLNCRMSDYVPTATDGKNMELEVKRYEFKLVALRCATVTGTLLDNAQAPLTNCRLDLVPTSRLPLLENPKQARFTFQSEPVATTDERGQFKFKEVNPGEYVVALVADAGLLFKSDTIQVEAEETLALGVLSTKIDPAVLNRDDDVLKEDGENTAPEK